VKVSFDVLTFVSLVFFAGAVHDQVDGSWPAFRLSASFAVESGNWYAFHNTEGNGGSEGRRRAIPADMMPEV
jgi:hypothetical protein